tara:strand:- start:12 stop:305 length:294 start_codon:yes stop_codon:yes gene_type:complete
LIPSRIPIKAKVNNIIQDSIYKDDISPIIIPKRIFDAFISTGIIKGKKITGNKKLFDVFVFVIKKIKIPKDNKPKLVTMLNSKRFNKISKLKSDKII